MAHQDDGAGVRREVLLEPVDGLDVEVVRRLIEQQHLGRAEQQPGERDAHPPAAGERAEWAAHLVGREAQAGQDRGGAALGGVRLARDQPVLDLAEALDDGEVVVRRVVGVLLHRARQLFGLRLQADDVVEGVQRLVQGRDGQVLLLGVLAQEPHCGAAFVDDVAFLDRLLAPRSRAAASTCPRRWVRRGRRARPRGRSSLGRRTGRARRRRGGGHGGTASGHRNERLKASRRRRRHGRRPSGSGPERR